MYVFCISKSIYKIAAQYQSHDKLDTCRQPSYHNVTLLSRILPGRELLLISYRLHLMNNSAPQQAHIMAERNVLLKNLKHPFLVGLHYSFQTPEKLYFVLDYVNGGEGHVVLTDFGLCKEGMEPEETTSTFCGTPEYLAPEVLKKQPYDRTVDWWCLGAVIYEMLYGLPPFYSRDVSQMYDNILHQSLQLPGGKTIAACDILRGLLHKDQHSRLGAKADFLEIKNHVFFSPINWDDLYHKRIDPPYNPNVAGPSDLRHFDPEFTKEAVSNSLIRTPDMNLSSSSSSSAFLGFSYAQSDEDFLS
ncbi:serine/threonine-protein kinase Sgk2 isoform X3 [Bombina bombina]|uniref:serine/threonine-protein kinase Sgk2 isoform X3 n=1 Tax=Bombina bombina TaxID=8345 RepID=UPI00235AD2C4|nr:serine/threonine-protein kinase Sgk2 isoform X3 [Bombina bombina]